MTPAVVRACESNPDNSVRTRPNARQCLSTTCAVVRPGRRGRRRTLDRSRPSRHWSLCVPRSNGPPIRSSVASRRIECIECPSPHPISVPNRQLFAGRRIARSIADYNADSLSLSLPPTAHPANTPRSAKPLDATILQRLSGGPGCRPPVHSLAISQIASDVAPHQTLLSIGAAASSTRRKKLRRGTMSTDKCKRGTRERGEGWECKVRNLQS